MYSLLFPVWSSPTTTDGQQAQQSSPTVEVTPPDSQPEDNGVTEEEPEGKFWTFVLYIYILRLQSFRF